MPFDQHNDLIVGWTQKEMIELLLFLIGYVGFPPIVDAFNKAKEVFAEQGVVAA